MSNILIVFDSITGKMESLALRMSELLKKTNQVRVKSVKPISGIHSKLLSEQIVSEGDLVWANAYIFCTPIYTGTFTTGIKSFVDQYHSLASKGAFFNKPFTAAAVGHFVHAGAETAIQQLYTIAMQWGMLIVSTSIVNQDLIEKEENPYGLSFLENQLNADNVSSILQDHLDRFSRITEVCRMLAIQKSVNTINKITDVL